MGTSWILVVGSFMLHTATVLIYIVLSFGLLEKAWTGKSPWKGLESHSITK